MKNVRTRGLDKEHKQRPAASRKEAKNNQTKKKDEVGLGGEKRLSGEESWTSREAGRGEMTIRCTRWYGGGIAERRDERGREREKEQWEEKGEGQPRYVAVMKRYIDLWHDGESDQEYPVTRSKALEEDKPRSRSLMI